MIKFLWKLLFGAPCKHDWRLLSEHEEASPLSKIKDFEGEGFTQDFLFGKHIQVFTCSKCGEFKRYVERV